MSARCGCSREGDATVFGLVHECSKDPDLRYGQQRTLPKLIPSWRFVVPETSEGVAADNPQQQLDELERPYERVLSDDCEPGDLG